MQDPIRFANQFGSFIDKLYEPTMFTFQVCSHNGNGEVNHSMMIQAANPKDAIIEYLDLCPDQENYTITAKVERVK